MEEFIKNKKNGKFGKIDEKIEDKINKEEKENIINNQSEIEGLTNKKKKNNIKKFKNKNKKAKSKKEEIKEKAIDLETITNKELFNFIFNDNMVIEYHSDSSENNDDDNNNLEYEDKKEEEKIED